MLKFFRRQKSSSENDNDVAANREKRNSLLSTSSCDEILNYEDTQSLQSGLSIELNEMKGDEDIFNYYSRFSMSLRSILKDTDCMTCFVQYLETRCALPIIKFYLDTENFKIAALEQLAKQEENEAKISNGNAQSKNETFENLNEQIEDEENDVEEASNNVPELKTLCDLSMHKPLTDDEKSQIYAETNKQITKCTATAHKLKSYSEQSLCSDLSLDSSATDETHNSPHQADKCISAASIKDALAIYQKYLSPNAKLYVELPVCVLSNLSLLLCKREDVSNHDDDEKLLSVSPDCFDEAQQFIFNELERLHLNEFLQSPFYCKYCLELISDEKINIKDILYSEVTLFYFMEFLEQHFDRECLDFWTAAINFRKSYAWMMDGASVDSKDIQDDAMIIYKKFFSLQSEQRLWLSDKLRLRVEESICATSASQIANCFDLSLMVMAKYLEKKYFNAFLNSEIFAQYLNELKTKINESHRSSQCLDEVDTNPIGLRSIKSTTTTTNSKRRHRKTLSDCTNDTFRSNVDVLKHISQHNTLLAMDTSAMHLKNIKSTASSMSIDAKQLTNPKLLWHRNCNSNSETAAGNGLKFGRVNALGRYERDFETIESFNNHTGARNHWSLGVSGNKIKNAMRKLVNLPEHNAQEEIAWQIAEMIVKDVTSITLNSTPKVNGDTPVNHPSC